MPKLAWVTAAALLIAIAILVVLRRHDRGPPHSHEARPVPPTAALASSTSTRADCGAPWPVRARRLTLCPERVADAVKLSVESHADAEVNVRIHERGAGLEIASLNPHYSSTLFAGAPGRCVDVTADYKPHFDGNLDWVYETTLVAPVPSNIEVRQDRRDASAPVGRILVDSGGVRNPRFE